MVTLVVATILITVAVPGMRNMIETNKVVSAANSISSVMNLARSEAAKRGLNVGVCVSNDQATCTGAGWKEGWLVWEDKDLDGVFDVSTPPKSSDEKIIQVGSALPVSTSVTSTQTTIVFNSTGFTTTPDTWKICDSGNGNVGYEVKLLASGALSQASQVTCP